MRTVVFHITTIWLTILLSLNNVCAQQDKMQSLPPIKITASTDLNQIVTDVLREMVDIDKAYLFYKADSSHLIKLMSNDELTPSLFDKTGCITYQISWGNLAALPETIVQLLDLVYDDYTVDLAISVNRNDKHSWIINLREGRKFYLIHLDERPNEGPIPQAKEEPISLSIRM